MKKYKWFVWSWKLSRYLAIPGLYDESRGNNPSVLVNFFDGRELPVMFSIPFFN